MTEAQTEVQLTTENIVMTIPAPKRSESLSVEQLKPFIPSDEIVEEGPVKDFDPKKFAPFVVVEQPVKVDSLSSDEEVQRKEHKIHPITTPLIYPRIPSIPKRKKETVKQKEPDISDLENETASPDEKSIAEYTPDSFHNMKQNQQNEVVVKKLQETKLIKPIHLDKKKATSLFFG